MVTINVQPDDLIQLKALKQQLGYKTLAEMLRAIIREKQVKQNDNNTDTNTSANNQ